MIILNNYSKIETYIVLDAESYSVVEKNKVQSLRQGVGGFSENGELIGIFVDNDKFFFLYNDKIYEAKPDEVICRLIRFPDKTSNFKVVIKDKTVCDITYKPYVSLLALPFGDDTDEFDFLSYLSKLLHDKNSIQNFITGMNNLKQFYS